MNKPNFVPNGLNVSDQVSEIVDRALEKQRDEQTPRNYLGGSRLGEECARRLWYEFKNVPSEKPFDGQTLRRFRRGHDGETSMIEFLRAAGFGLVTEMENGRQFGFYVAKDQDGVARIAGHLDGVIVSLPQLPDGKAWRVNMQPPLLWENKVLAHKGIEKLRKEGLRKAYPVYYVQMQVYMAYMDLPNGGLFTAEDADDCTIYAEFVPFNMQAAQEASDRGVRVVTAQAASELPRVTHDPQDYRCRFCPYEERCWTEAQPANVNVHVNQQPAPPAWLNQG